MFTNRHFQIYVFSQYTLNMIHRLKKCKGVVYIFNPIKYVDYNDPDEEYGDYDIIIKTSDYLNDSNHLPFELISDYEVLTIGKSNYENLLDARAEKSYDELYSKYSRTIQPEIDKAVQLAIKGERQRILNQDFKKEYETEILERASCMYNEFKQRFADEKCDLYELCELYRKKIDILIHHNIRGLLDHLNKRFIIKPNPKANDNTRGDRQGLNQLNDLFILSGNNLTIGGSNIRIYCFGDVYELNKEVKRIKNNIVDNIVKMYGVERGHRDYHRVMIYAGKLADEIESTMMRLYTPHYIDGSDII